MQFYVIRFFCLFVCFFQNHVYHLCWYYRSHTLSYSSQSKPGEYLYELLAFVLISSTRLVEWNLINRTHTQTHSYTHREKYTLTKDRHTNTAWAEQWQHSRLKGKIVRQIVFWSFNIFCVLPLSSRIHFDLIFKMKTLTIRFLFPCPHCIQLFHSIKFQSSVGVWYLSSHRENLEFNTKTIFLFIYGWLLLLVNVSWLSMQ